MILQRGGIIKYYRLTSISFMIIFASVGFIFLLAPDLPLAFFNSISGKIGMVEAPLKGFGFYLVLASGYMYMVSILSYLMYSMPSEKILPLLLANAKLASSVLSIGFFIFQGRYLIYLANFAVDGFIGVIAVYFYLNIGKSEK